MGLAGRPSDLFQTAPRPFRLLDREAERSREVGWSLRMPIYAIGRAANRGVDLSSDVSHSPTAPVGERGGDLPQALPTELLSGNQVKETER